MPDAVMLTVAVWLALVELMWLGPVERFRLRHRWANAASAPIWFTGYLYGRLFDATVFRLVGWFFRA